MYGLHWSESLSLVLFWVVCAIAGALILMQRLSAICSHEKQFGLPEANWLGAIIGGLGGAGVAGIGIYFYFFAPAAAGWVEWTGRSAYVLVLGSSTAHLATFIHFWRRLNAEGKGTGALTALRQQQVDKFRQSRENYADLKARDDEAIDELLAVFGERLLFRAARFESRSILWLFGYRMWYFADGRRIDPTE